MSKYISIIALFFFYHLYSFVNVHTLFCPLKFVILFFNSTGHTIYPQFKKCKQKGHLFF